MERIQLWPHIHNPFHGPSPATATSPFSLAGLNPATAYAARLAVQTMGGTGKSAIRLFTNNSGSAISVAGPCPRNIQCWPTVSAGQTATYKSLISDGGNGYTGTATFSCTGAPSEATCAVTPSTINIGLNAAPFTITVTTTAPSTAFLRRISSNLVLAIGLFLPEPEPLRSARGGAA